MRRFGGRVLCVVLLTGCSLAAAAQQSAPAKPAGSSSSSATKSAENNAKTAPGSNATANWASYCSAEAGFCVKYPSEWKKLTDVLQGAGVVVARPEAGQPEEVWPQITAAATLLPEEPEGKTAPDFNDVLNVMLDSIEPGAQKETLQRTQTTAGGLPADLLKIKYMEAGGKAWIEEGVFIDGDDAIYSVVLRCQPDQVASLEPLLQEIVRTWKTFEGSTAPAKEPVN